MVPYSVPWTLLRSHVNTLTRTLIGRRVCTCTGKILDGYVSGAAKGTHWREGYSVRVG